MSVPVRARPDLRLFKHFREIMGTQYKVADEPSYGLHLGVDFGEGFVWLHVLMISSKPGKFITYTLCTLVGYAKYIWVAT